MHSIFGYDLPKKFFFYPAQYWPHKNHIYLVDGLEVALKELKFEISAVFCGSDKGNLNFVQNHLILNYHLNYLLPFFF